MWSSSDETKHYIVGVLAANYIDDKDLIDLIDCKPGTMAIYVSVYPHLDWIRSLVGNEMCLMNRWRWKWKEFALYLPVVALSTLATCLIGRLLITELRSPKYVARIN